jgi:hypothetical protein
MAILSFDGPRDGSSTTSALLPLDSHFSFQAFSRPTPFHILNLVLSLPLQKATMDGTPMVVTIIWGFVKCKLQVALWNYPYNPPRLPLGAYTIFFSIFSS